jgi:uncharacterized membrane protein YbhN (UPF0104 family)
MEDMPQHDPVPQRTHDYERVAVAWARYKRIMRWMVVVAIVTVLVSLLILRNMGDPMPLHMIIATIAGIGLTMLVGTGLMGLAYFSNRSGVDDDAGAAPDDRE